MPDIKKTLIGKINKSEWWHVPPRDVEAYHKRGKFLASTHQQAEFYGRPNDIPEKVTITNPVYGFSEREILDQLFPERDNTSLFDNLASENCWYQKRIDLDAEMFKRAKSLGYDAIVLMTETGRKELERNKKPRTIELNLLTDTTDKQAKPFLKWAGGKGQLLEQFKSCFPKELNGAGIIKYYYEPFLGGGAVLFWVMQNCKIKKAYVNELNPEIYLCYVAIQRDVELVIKCLKSLEQKYNKLTDKQQEAFYYEIRDSYNKNRGKVNFRRYDSKTFSERSAMTICLNRTCFNGLYRLNAKGDFNVPFGRYKNPSICNEENLRAISKLLQDVTITNKDFSIVQKQVKPDSFVYFDPPYRPLNKTSNFTSYLANIFDDKEQIRLAELVKDLDQHDGVKIMLSNSDPKNENKEDEFFDKLYEGFTIKRLSAKRMINCNASKRGKINELIILNY